MKNLKIAIASMFALFTVQANAALPAEVGTAFTTMQTDVEALLALAWPVIAAITIGFLLIKFFKKASNKV